MENTIKLFSHRRRFLRNALMVGAGVDRSIDVTLSGFWSNRWPEPIWRHC